MQVCRYNLFARLGSMLSTSERSLVNRLSAVLELLPPALDARLVAVTGLNAFDNAVLATLAAADQETLRMTALASHTNATLPRLSRVVSRLEARGLIGRRQCPSDARATNASLTHAGADHLAASQLAGEAVLRELLVEAVEPALVEPLSRALGQLLLRLDPEGRYAVTTCPSIRTSSSE